MLLLAVVGVFDVGDVELEELDGGVAGVVAGIVAGVVAGVVADVVVGDETGHICWMLETAEAVEFVMLMV